jgi:transposase
MVMLTTFQCRLYPTKQQQRLRSRQLEERRWRWKTLLAERKRAWEEQQEMVDSYEQKAELPSLKAGERPSLSDVHSERRPLGATSTRSDVHSERRPLASPAGCGAAPQESL